MVDQSISKKSMPSHDDTKYSQSVSVAGSDISGGGNLSGFTSGIFSRPPPQQEHPGPGVLRVPWRDAVLSL